MKWEKLGRIFEPAGEYDWMITHSANPVAESLGEGLFRVYFSSRNKNNQSSISFIEIDIKAPDRIIRLSDNPVVSPGEPGMFDDSGATVCCIAFVDGKKYLYYMGWNLAVTVPYRNSVGLSISESQGVNFKKFSVAPIIDRSEADPFTVSYPWIIRDGAIWKMWYGSNLGSGAKQTDMAHVIKYAESHDAIHWERQGRIAVNFKSPDEYAISRPCVIKENGIYRMWYSHRGKNYMIGYAESKEGINWTRMDERAGIEPSKSGWDSEMIEYPFVFDYEGKRYMLYNGNGYGKTGMGLAVLVSDE